MESLPDDITYAAARTLRLLGDRRSPAAEAARRCAHRVLDDRQLRGLAHRPADAAPGASGADRRAAPSRRAALELARIRDAGRRLAFLRALRTARHPPDARDQRPHM